MANKFRGEVDIVLDKPRKVFFDHTQLLEVEDLFDCRFAELDFSSLRLKQTIQLLHLGLLHEDADLSFEDAIELSEYMDLVSLTEKVMNAYVMACTKNNKTLEQQIKEAAKSQKKSKKK
jgi:hypothetical protein